MVRSFYTDDVTRVRAPLADDGHGNDAPDWDNAATSTLSGCRFQPISVDEALEHRFEAHIEARLLGPSGMDVTFLDRITYGGVTYEVVGPPMSNRSPTGAAAHTELLLRRVS